MDSESELQEQEITALKSIYAEDFIEPQRSAWKNAVRLPEFNIRIQHPDSKKVSFLLNVKLPKTYPLIKPAIFSIEKPIQGLSHEQVAKLLKAINGHAGSKIGSEMVFEIVTFAQEWLSTQVTPPVEVQGSLALQMNQRAVDAERLRQLQKEQEEAEEKARALQQSEDLQSQIMEDLARQQKVRERQSRNRASSTATEMPSTMSGDVSIETFDEDMELNGIVFRSIKYFHPQPYCLGTKYVADPICDDVNATLPLELYVVSFHEHHYTTTQGRKKLTQIWKETNRLTNLRHPNVISVLGVKLILPHSGAAPQLMILSEQAPSVTLHDVLEDCDSLKEERASDYLGQILTALSAIHAKDLVHRGLTTRCIGLVSSNNPTQSKQIKMGKVGYHTRLLDLHRSNPISPILSAAITDEGQLPDAWVSKEVKTESQLLYTRHRDIHSVGIVFLQMLLGLDVTEKYSDVHTALPSVSAPLHSLILTMLLPSKRNHVSCLSLLADNARISSDTSPTRTNGIPVPGAEPRTPMAGPSFGSPEMEYFRKPEWKTSRWKEDWEELELLGKGGFGSVVKARNKIDSRIYAVKKIRLRRTDTKIFREVNALSRLSHSHIVRYYTTWMEETDPSSNVNSDTETETEDGFTSTVSTFQSKRSRSDLPDDFDSPFQVYDDNDDQSLRGLTQPHSSGSFPCIVDFENSSSESDGDADAESDGDLPMPSKKNKEKDKEKKGRGQSGTTTPSVPPRTLYIQMEFVERQTLKERIDEGISEDEAWRLFQQIVDALVHMSALGILHRDIKLTNIFIDARGDCKVGDFGLATSSLLAVDQSDKSPYAIMPSAEMTLEVGTHLYIAPEVQSRARTKHPATHNKADMYSLGIVFFEMNYRFDTSSERIAVIENLRQPSIVFPAAWNPLLTHQRQIITWLLKHNPDERPTALELSQSPLLPHKLEDEYFRSAMNMMVKRDSPHHEAVLSSLFNQLLPPSKSYLYDFDENHSRFASLDKIVQDRLAAIFGLHGAIDTEPPLLMPAIKQGGDDPNMAKFIDRFGDVVVLPNNLIHPFARMAARVQSTRIKRYFLGNTYEPNGTAGHPKGKKTAIFDIITHDLASGTVAAPAELAAVASKILDSFPNLGRTYEIQVSHSSIADIAFSRVSPSHRDGVMDVLTSTKPLQKRTNLLKHGLTRSAADELEVLSDTYEDVDTLFLRLEKVSSTIGQAIRPALEEIRMAVKYAATAGVGGDRLVIRPLMLSSVYDHFQDGVVLGVVKRGKPSDVLAIGGRYNHLIAQYALLEPKSRAESLCAFALQVDVEEIKSPLAKFQRAVVFDLDRESFGLWSPRRCDVYIISQQAGFLQDRLDLVTELWQNNISADIMYENGLQETENYMDICMREGILFIVNPRPHTGMFKVKSVLKGVVDAEVSRQELVPWLRHQIAERKRLDQAKAGASTLVDTSPSLPLQNGGPDVQVIYPKEKKGQRSGGKSKIIKDKATMAKDEIKKGFMEGMPTIAIDVTPSTFDTMVRSSAWLSDDDAWKALCAGFPASHLSHPMSIREAILKHKMDGHAFVLLYLKDDGRTQLLKL